MVRHVSLKRNVRLYEDHYCSQAGYGIPVFVGGTSQKGRVTDSFFGGLGRMKMPWIRLVERPCSEKDEME
jgi:hypothetical protein